MERYVLTKTLYPAFEVDTSELYLSRNFLVTRAILKGGKPSAAQWHGMTLARSDLNAPVFTYVNIHLGTANEPTPTLITHERCDPLRRFLVTIQDVLNSLLNCPI